MKTQCPQVNKERDEYRAVTIIHINFRRQEGRGTFLECKQGSLLTLLVAKEKGRAFFVVIVGGSHEIYAGRRNQTKVEGPFDSLRGIDDFVRSITKGGGEPLWTRPPRPRFFCIVRGPAAAEQRGIAAPSPGAIPGPSSRRADRA